LSTYFVSLRPSRCVCSNELGTMTWWY